MPSTNNQALLIELQAFLANNNIRRGVLSVAVNASAAGNQYLEQSLDVPANGSVLFTCGLTNNCTVIRALKPVTVTVSKGEDTFTFLIASLFVFTDHLDRLEFVNASTTDIATLRLLQI